MKPGLFAAVIVAVFLLGFGVGRTSAQPGGAPVQPAMSAPMAAAPAQTAPMAMGGGEMPAPGAQSVVGTVAEVIQVPSYTYLRLTTASGEQWAAISTNPDMAVGQLVTVVGTEMVDFTSTTLKRTFSTIWFGNLQNGGAKPSMGAPSAPVVAAPPANSGGAMAAVAKADGPLGVRVADVYSGRKALSGKTVRVKGLVTKVNAVQGINYVHVKDGSGAAATGDDDLIIMTTASVKVDEVPTLEGKVVVDKDVGMGPRPVMLEEAKVVGN